MKLTVIAFMISFLLLSLGCTSNTEAPSTADVVDSVSESSAPTAPVVLPPDSEDSADQAAISEPEKQPAAPEIQLPEAALTIGSKAPSLDIEHWISDGQGAFGKVADFEADKIYIVEFWATWCGPCVQSMPHLVKLQEEFKDSVQVVSVSNEDLETVTAFLERPYKNGGEDGPQTYGELTSTYCLTTDPDRTVDKDYMEAAGRNGIPACFVVGKTGLIEWIGHPMALDEQLSQVVDGTWDRDAFAVEFKKEQAFDMVMSQIYEAAQAGDMEKANQLVEQARGFAGPQQLRQIDQIAFQLKMAPVGKMMQAGDVAGAVAATEKLMEEAEGPMKSQLGSVLEQIKEQLEASREEESEDATVEPAE